MSKDTADNNAAAAERLEQRIRAAITQTEREFGVYIATQMLFSADGPGGDHCRFGFTANVWPVSMRIVETERESKAIG